MYQRMKAIILVAKNDLLSLSFIYLNSDKIFEIFRNIDKFFFLSKPIKPILEIRTEH